MAAAETFANKVAIVTGGASGLGAALATELAANGARVVVADCDTQRARAVVASIGPAAESVMVDVSQPSQVESLVHETRRKYGALDLMVNNAAVLGYGNLSSFPLSDWRRILSVNLEGVITGSLAAYDVMVQQRSGHIVNIASLSALVVTPLAAPYSTSKSAVLSFSLQLAAEAELNGVRVTVVCPGNLQTPMIRDISPSRFTPAIPADVAARHILRAVARDKRLVVFPLYARVLWWLERLHPNLLRPLRREMLRRAKLRRGSASDKLAA